MNGAEDVLDDLLAEGLSVVFCGTQPGRVSATRQAYYAKPGNRFWKTLFEIGLTPRCFAPHEYRELLKLGIGLTDLAKRTAGQDIEIAPKHLDVARLKGSLRRFRPTILAFTSKNAAVLAFGERKLSFGPQSLKFGDIETYVLPSTSGLAIAHWDIRHWHGLAARLGEMKQHAATGTDL